MTRRRPSVAWEERQRAAARRRHGCYHAPEFKYNTAAGEPPWFEGVFVQTTACMLIIGYSR